ncbi:hypothetical protein OSB04_002165 [Centaurea solstitialis]|uniref:Protein kinase domain-containing protein n=1 Tax=Centaurea solstitialis TaxID=347529 RepID=A0AA38TU69_9ASTR|nr:hypothetical protein OSB04_002165 [Centaurea solstitialis]
MAPSSLSSIDGFGPVCNFTGIVCSGENSVKEIDLSHQKLAGALDFDSICSSSLESSLEKLSLGSNLLHGTITSHVSNCTNLNYLDLSDNHFSGEFLEISSLTKIHFLKLNLSGFSGQFPWKLLQYLTNLTKLSLGDNPFELIPFPFEILNLEKLQNLFLSNSSIQGTIPEAIGDLLSLQTLELSDNYLRTNSCTCLRTSFPVEFGAFKFLKQISIYRNKFTGELPPRIGSWADFEYIEVAHNLLTGTILKSRGSCVSLVDINLARNSISGQIPASLGSIPPLKSLNVSANKLSGVIPASLLSLNLDLIDLSNNTLIGQLPEWLPKVNKSSFGGNLGLCADRRRDVRSCSLGSRKFGDFHGNLHVKKYWFIAVGLLLLLLLSCFLFVKLRRKYRKPSTDRGFSWDMKTFHNISINDGKILRSLNQENLIGRGGSRNVYKVELGCGKKLAIKHMSKSGIDSSNRTPIAETILPRQKSRWSEYDAEVAILSSTRHINLVKLYCSITSEDSNLLVYEYMPNGSLWDRLHMYQEVEMDWNVRYMIAMGPAQGLEYLHHKCAQPVIHRDVKSSNILLDEETKPKIADFGLAKIVQENNVMDSTEIIAGT